MKHHWAMFRFKKFVLEILVISLIALLCSAGAMQNVTPVYIGGF